MAATFDPALLTVRDRLRFALGDTDMDKPLIQDETYDAMYAWHGNNEQRTLAELADSLVTQYGRKPVQIKAGDVTVDYRERLTVWRDLAARSSPGRVPGMSVRRPERFEEPQGEYRRR